VFHACRHSCASTLLAEGAPLTAVAGHTGDTVETVSRTHFHWLRDDRDIPAQVLDRMLSRLVWSRPHCPARWSEVRFFCHRADPAISLAASSAAATSHRSPGRTSWEGARIAHP
jgi:hypothetical protein